jgi:hypothetical protein
MPPGTSTEAYAREVTVTPTYRDFRERKAAMSSAQGSPKLGMEHAEQRQIASPPPRRTENEEFSGGDADRQVGDLGGLSACFLEYSHPAAAGIS